MSDFPGHAQVGAVLTRLRSELKKTVLVAAAPRVFDGDWLPTSGGYGLTLPADVPENWGAGRITSTIDQLCPILEAWRWASLDDGTQIEDTHLADTGFTAADIYGTTDAALDINLRGCGYMLLEQESLGSNEDEFHGSRRAEECAIRVTIRVPVGFGQAQGQLYVGLLAQILGERSGTPGVKTSSRINIGDSDTEEDQAFLQFGWVPQMGRIEEESGEFLGLVWEAQATRYYTIP